MVSNKISLKSTIIIILLIILAISYLPILITAFAYGNFLDLIYISIYALYIIVIIKYISLKYKIVKKYFIFTSILVLIMNIRILYGLLVIAEGTDKFVIAIFVIHYIYNIIVVYLVKEHNFNSLVEE